jgi:hypothetical protein
MTIGRPRIFGDELVSESITLRVTPEQRRELEQVARDNQTTLAGAIREAVNSFVSDYRDGDAVFRGREDVKLRK